MQQNIIGVLSIMDNLKIKVNYSDLERKYNISRQTIKKYHMDGGIIKKERKKRISKFDKHCEEIKTLFKTTETNIIGAFYYLKEKYSYSDEEFKYGSFKDYVRKHNLKEKRSLSVHLRYETKPGEQLQVDFKESIKIRTITNEEIKFNIFVATLGYSRLHTWIYSKDKTTESFIRCLIETLNKLGGKPKKILTDNMSAVVSLTNGYKKKHPIIRQLEKDIGIKISLCKVRSPETKGKVESANRFFKRLLAYDNKIIDEADLIAKISKINNDINLKTNETTKIPPIKLFMKEKEYLNPLPEKLLLENYLTEVTIHKVDKTLLVRYEGKEYSVPKEYINKRVKIIRVANDLYIYYNTELITIHKISESKINYNESHYIEALKTKFKKGSEDDINKKASENLKLLGEIGNGK